MSGQTLAEILERLAQLRERVPSGRAHPLAPDSTWLRPAENDERLEWTLAQAGAVMVELDQEARVLYVSPNVEQILGLGPGEFRGLYVGDCVHPEDLERLVDVSLAMSEGSSPDRPCLRVRHREGRWIHLEAISAARFHASDGTLHSVSVLCDVTRRHEAWAALRESEERYRVMAESSRDAIAEVDEEARHTFASGLEEVLGFTAEEFADMEPFALVHPEDRERVAGQLEKAFDSDDVMRIEPFRIYRKDGLLIWYECTGVTYRRATGERRFLTVGRDVTHRLRAEAERRAFDARRQQALRLESLGVLAGGIAHDFNNLLTPILGEAKLALADLPEDAPLRERLDRIIRAGQRAADLTQKMLVNAGAEAPRPEHLDLSPIAEDASRSVKLPETGTARLRVACEDPLPCVRGDAAQIFQVVENLIVNAVEALGDRPGQVDVRTGEVRLNQKLEGVTPTSGEPLAPGHYAFVEVADDGCGMESDVRARIFDPFFTTKFPGRGLGLAAVAGIVRNHRGGIQIETHPGRGSRFRVLLPAQETEAGGD